MNNKNHRADAHRRNCVQLLAALVLLLLSTAPAVAQNKPEIQWELVNSFRFISDHSSMDDLRSVYDGLEKKTADNLERKLQRNSEEAVQSNRATAQTKFDCAHTKSAEEQRQCFEPYLGWFEKLARNNYAKTCWDADNRRFRDEGDCKDYIYPKTHRVRVWITNLNPSGGQTPQWFIDGQALTKVDNCDAKYKKPVCAEFEVEYDPDERAERMVSVRLADGGPTIGPAPVLVKDRLIVGLGDSYASGEGNPDIPAQFTRGRTDPDFFLYEFKLTNSPQKDAGTDAAWLERRCHRSMYSYQFKTALQLALHNPRQAVTYVSYSCSAASTDNIIGKGQTPNEGFKLFKISPQLDALRKVLENKKGKTREIDYLLLSTGGNDMGFAKFVAYIVTTKAARQVLTHGVGKKKFEEMASKETIRKRILTGTDDDSGNYFRLLRALEGPKGVKIKGWETKQHRRRILLTPYPNILNNEDAKLCVADRQEFDVPFRKDSGRDERIKLVNKYVFDAVKAAQEDPLVTSAEPGLGWTLVSSHLSQYTNHGFCAQTRQQPLPVDERFVMPKKENGKWESFDPREYKAYGARERWVRLPVDSKLTTDQVVIFWKFSLDLLLSDDRSNIMHPTAEALAVTAEANFREILKLEGKAN